MLVFALFCIMSSLPHYEVTVEPYYLEQLLADPAADLEVPATVSLDGVTGECTLAFRGATSLGCAKKSWRITTLDADLFPGGDHILLNAQFRDASLMRNTLGLYITREMGFPAPKTEFVTLSINNANYGVYEHVERIDRLFYERNGVSFGPLFKNVDTTGRLSQHFADTTGMAGYEPKVDSSPYKAQLLELIESCFRGDVSSLAVDEVLAAFAVHVAICDNDGIIKNFYLHRSDNIWHYYPWDRDATFGNTWQGEYHSSWVRDAHLADIGYFGASRAILLEPGNIEMFNDLLEESAEIMGEDLPEIVDSIRLLIRNDLAEDPFYQYSVSQFDSICSTIVSDMELRSEFLEDLSIPSEISAIGEISISSCLDMQSDIDIEVELSGGDPSGLVCLVSFDGQKEQWFYMEHDREDEWSISIPVPSGTYCVHTAYGPYETADFLPVFYPSWGMRGCPVRLDPCPSARVSLADLSPSLFSIQPPVWCGNNLWVLPVVNTGSQPQDLSLCRFSLGDPDGNVFLPGSTLVAPGETFLLSNSRDDASSLYGDVSIFGDAGTGFPAGTELTLYDPSWNSLFSWQIGGGDSLPSDLEAFIPSEIRAGGGSDWVEIYNRSQNNIDVSQWYFTDSNNNVSVIPDGTTVPHHSLLLAAEEPGSFSHLPRPAAPLTFGIDSEKDFLSLFTRYGDPVFSIGWDERWPMEETGIMYLKAPWLYASSSSNWAAASLPGTPGEANPGWNSAVNYTTVSLVSQNPCDGSFIFHYQTSASPVEAMLFDLTGRIVARIDLPEEFQGDVTADFSSTLPSGVYILYLRSSAGAASTRFTVLK
ncbi:hypothetical protein DRQ21_09765 [Candidatus Fermentibacteria bacterium]|nr:MAG: hypothetical protein DRQ21_09765 [Candidatus Fermentibacteria bacterium]